MGLCLVAEVNPVSTVNATPLQRTWRSRARCQPERFYSEPSRSHNTQATSHRQRSSTHGATSCLKPCSRSGWLVPLFFPQCVHRLQA